MATLQLARYKTPLLVVSALILIWGLFGVIDVRNQTYTGYATDGNNTITQVTNGGPADLAGLETGDYIRAIGGIRVEDVGATVQRSRPDINETRTIEVERDGQPVSVEMSYAALPLANLLVNYGFLVIGFLFLVCGVWGFLVVQTGVTLLLAVLGITLSIPLTVGPYFDAPGLRTAVGVVLLLLILVGFASLAHLLLIFPTKKRVLERRNMIWVVYGPAILVGIMATWVLVVAPAATSAVNVFFRVLFGLFLITYFGTALFALIHSYVKASREDRTSQGLNLLLLGAVAGLGPSLTISLVGIVAPQVVVPGAQFLPLGLAFLPVTFAISAVKVERAEQAVG